ncbi:hypothetical protein EYF80_047004 [Liparis tanakae]|uniref:Uncharacterized protein n=1 Tax=Liparis tanakae TaxID=230148 RepID=A0A4Z2FPV7_9TELE|nr:hypothetical protein EYF80_047004 [Liparis tanakae]
MFLCSDATFCSREETSRTPLAPGGATCSGLSPPRPEPTAGRSSDAPIGRSLLVTCCLSSLRVIELSLAGCQDLLQDLIQDQLPAPWLPGCSTTDPKGTGTGAPPSRPLFVGGGTSGESLSDDFSSNVENSHFETPAVISSSGLRSVSLYRSCSFLSPSRLHFCR